MQASDTGRGDDMKVLVAIDDSEYSLRAVDSILQRDWPENSEFRIITVVEPVYSYAYTGADMAPIFESLAEFEKECKKRVDDIATRFKQKFPESAVSGQVVEGLVSCSIVEAAKNWAADLIVLGSHGRRGFQKLLLGSVAEKVAGLADCSVEIVKARNPGKNHDSQKARKSA